GGVGALGRADRYRADRGGRPRSSRRRAAPPRRGCASSVDHPAVPLVGAVGGAVMLHIVLPAYNEEEGLEKLLERIRRIARANAIDYRLLIINDGSRDHTAQVVQSFASDMPIDLVSFATNAGVTEVFRTGFRRVCAEAGDEDICITMDADNTQNPYVILDVLKKLQNGCDLVVASRFEPGGGMVKAPVL